MDHQPLSSLRSTPLTERIRAAVPPSTRSYSPQRNSHTMVVRIRFSRIGGRNNPLYRVVVANNKTRRDGLPLEAVGFYNPVPKTDGTKFVDLAGERIKYWLSVGAQPTPPVKKMLARAGFIPELPFHLRPFMLDTPNARRVKHMPPLKPEGAASK
ncbi:37S ribosomal protein S16, mitochondrial [Blastocladiella emersonii ATCC 22665]|nr:37S ribosomal protein S16, mitochondrial [Blastocladiella emersonii ATCC 22665]